MSWARFGEDSDLYIFSDARGGITCMVCQLMDTVPMRWPEYEMHDDFNCETEEQMIEHIKKHIAAGHLVPDDLRWLVQRAGAGR